MTNPAFFTDFTSAVLDPRITFARTGDTATRINSSGFIETVAADQPRFDFNSVTLACRGLLVEEARTNLQPYSQDITQAGTWSLSNLTATTEAIAAPDGAASVNTVTENTFNDVHTLATTVNLSASTTYTMSVYAKKVGSVNRFVTIGASSSFSVYIATTFDLDNLTATQTLNNGFTLVGTSAVLEKNGYVRVSMTFSTGVNTPSLIRYGLAPTGTHANFSRGFAGYTGSTSCEYVFWGMQIEAGSFPTSYIPTTTAAVTRNADVATITGTNFSDWWQAGRGGVSVSAIPSTVSGTRPLIQFDDATADNLIALQGNTTNPELYIVDSTTPQAQIDAGTIAAGTPYTLTGWWQTDFCAARKDNGAKVTDGSATIPTVTQARLGSDGTNYLNGHLATINYYDQFSSRIYTRRKNKAVFSVL